MLGFRSNKLNQIECQTICPPLVCTLVMWYYAVKVKVKVKVNVKVKETFRGPYRMCGDGRHLGRGAVPQGRVELGQYSDS